MLTCTPGSVNATGCRRLTSRRRKGGCFGGRTDRGRNHQNYELGYTRSEGRRSLGGIPASSVGGDYQTSPQDRIGVSQGGRQRVVGLAPPSASVPTRFGQGQTARARLPKPCGGQADAGRVSVPLARVWRYRRNWPGPRHRGPGHACRPIRDTVGTRPRPSADLSFRRRT